jgi:diguanylate cyclase (GGDEF)-like protein
MKIDQTHLSDILDNLEETIIIFSEDGTYRHIFGGVYEGLAGKKISDSLPCDTSELFMSKLTEAVSKDEVITFEYAVSALNIFQEFDKTGDCCSYHRAKIMPISINGERCAAWIAYDISDLKIMENNFNNCALEDPVTGIYNRRFLFKELNNFFQRFKRGGYEYSVIMIGLDSVGNAEDAIGSGLSEKIMENLLGIIKSNLRTSDMIAGGSKEEIIILLPDTPSNGAFMMAERLRSAIGSHIFEADDRQYRFTASFGCSMVCDKDTSYENIINRAEIALYQARHKGGDFVKRIDYEHWNRD